MAPPAVRLTDDQIRSYIIAFHRHDINKDGVLERAELEALLADVKLEVTQEKLNQTLEAIGYDEKVIDKTGLLQVRIAICVSCSHLSG
jgi:Ca2+-binding EF-hand superfamily protein